MQTEQAPQSARSSFGGTKNEQFLQSLKKKYSGKQDHIVTQVRGSNLIAGLPTAVAASGNSPLKQKIINIIQDKPAKACPVMAQPLPQTTPFDYSRRQHSYLQHQRNRSAKLLNLSAASAPRTPHTARKAQQQLTSSPIRQLYDTAPAHPPAPLTNSRTARLHQVHEQRRQKSRSHRQETARTISSIDELLSTIRNSLGRKLPPA